MFENVVEERVREAPLLTDSAPDEALVKSELSTVTEEEDTETRAPVHSHIASSFDDDVDAKEEEEEGCVWERIEEGEEPASGAGSNVDKEISVGEDIVRIVPVCD